MASAFTGFAHRRKVVGMLELVEARRYGMKAGR